MVLSGFTCDRMIIALCTKECKKNLIVCFHTTAVSYMHYVRNVLINDYYKDGQT